MSKPHQRQSKAPPAGLDRSLEEAIANSQKVIERSQAAVQRARQLIAECRRASGEPDPRPPETLSRALRSTSTVSAKPAPR
jgi:hypothetical protein